MFFPHEPVTDIGATFIANRPQLRMAALKILGNIQRAEDVVQDAYMKVVEGGGFLEVKQPVAYLFQVVRNLASDRHRRAVLESQVCAHEDDGLEVPHLGGTPEMLAMHRQHLRLVVDALSTLPERTRHAFELHRLGGLTQREVAKTLGVSTTMVNFMVRDAMNCCRDALTKATQA
ncbi:RNA polymerase factor sigma-70 [Paucibacter sp. XJ19-41]|uniref:RNA polymerase factor sigma-70 n=1 Tax=Paucibacter sp. XJ19-41 TaxID=2927824 RepID=UPI00234B104A|nr:RNA polymerase factor sigma-70 [Paucibacter sp. XJ19-41]MDC6169384.1 RNA polymerase factor sigma-70 [Paucibacter sp. XJ19-41]